MNNAVDRLSGLPSPLLDHILSLLPTKDVVRTCVLSQSWRNVWCYVPSFHFDGRHFSGEEDFVEFVESALFLRDGSNIRKLHLTFGSKDSISNYTLCRPNKWIIYAIRHHVEVLEIALNLLWRYPFVLTSKIFTCQSLRELRLSCYKCHLMLPASCWLPSLEFLQFSSICFMDVQVTSFVSSAFPSLETLIIEECFFKSHKLHISVPQLKNLSIEGQWSILLEISADTPNLISLKLDLTNEMIDFVEFNAISLVNANINLLPCNSDSFSKLIRVLESVRSLTLHVGNLMAIKNDLSILASIQIPFYNMKWLMIQTSFSEREIVMINTFLKHSSQLETLFLEHRPVRTTTAEYRFDAEEVCLKYKLPYLRLVEIQGFRGSRNEVKLAKFILKHATVLEKLIITASKPREDSMQLNRSLASKQKVVSTIDPKQLEITGKNLLSSPRASQSVSVLFT